jgi:hypothetical protein
MEKRIKATKIEVVPRQHQPNSSNASSSRNVSTTTRQATNHRHSPPKSDSSSGQGCLIFVFVGVCIVIVVALIEGGGGSGDSSGSSSSVLDSALKKGAEGRATEMTNAEMEAFRLEQQRISNEHKERVLGGLTPAEKTLRDYEDRMILKGETESNPYYEELQRRANESR